MPITVRATDILFNDSTTQSTAGDPYVQRGMQVFTSSGTFTVPAGVTSVKVRLCGGGGRGRMAGNGGTSSFGSYCSATGGTAGGANSPGTGGTGTGDFTLAGGGGGLSGTSSSSNSSGGSCGGGKGNSSFGLPGYLGGISGYTYSLGNATGYGNGGGATGDAVSAYGGGGGGGYAESLVTGLTPSQQITVTVGAAGGSNATQGIVIVEW